MLVLLLLMITVVVDAGYESRYSNQQYGGNQYESQYQYGYNQYDQYDYRRDRRQQQQQQQ